MNAPGGMMRLRQVIEQSAEAANASLGNLTVMSALIDLCRMDTPANHRDAAWLAESWLSIGAKRPIHLRGLRYALVSAAEPLTKPDGSQNLNTHEDSIWRQAVANNARWLGDRR
jgi:hypothetical protein